MTAALCCFCRFALNAKRHLGENIFNQDRGLTHPDENHTYQVLIQSSIRDTLINFCVDNLLTLIFNSMLVDDFHYIITFVPPRKTYFVFIYVIVLPSLAKGHKSL
ncbi:hypothetical protein [Phascolarctobacterium sp.]|uniref:hypothetical protein n=1 Tax=Phascolarctobacterium sp. TaxID=2049039 RepID=UPI0030D8BF9C